MAVRDLPILCFPQRDHSGLLDSISPCHRVELDNDNLLVSVYDRLKVDIFLSQLLLEERQDSVDGTQCQIETRYLGIYTFQEYKMAYSGGFAGSTIIASFVLSSITR